MITVRTIERHERDAVLDLLREWLGDRDFFKRYFDHDPAFRDDLCLVATDDGRLVSTLQVFPKEIAVGEVRLRVGGLGNVFTTDAYRGRGIASTVLRRAIEIMEQDGFDLSLLFASRLTFYSQFGWQAHRRRLGALALAAELPEPQLTVRPFEPERDLDAVMRIYDAYNRGRNGAVVRDRTYWQGQLRYAGNPAEVFLLTERRGEVVAYARLISLYDVWMVMEHGALDGEEEALADVLLALGERARAGGFMVFHLGAHPEVGAALQQRGLPVNDVEDVFSMWRLINTEQLAGKLGVGVDEVRHPEFIDRLLPYDGSVYWTSDRF